LGLHANLPQCGFLVGINDSFELTDGVWRRWFGRPISKTNGRPFVQGVVSEAYTPGLNAMIVREILGHFANVVNMTEDYVRGISRITEHANLMPLV